MNLKKNKQQTKKKTEKELINTENSGCQEEKKVRGKMKWGGEPIVW